MDDLLGVIFIVGVVCLVLYNMGVLFLSFQALVAVVVCAALVRHVRHRHPAVSTPLLAAIVIILVFLEFAIGLAALTIGALGVLILASSEKHMHLIDGNLGTALARLLSNLPKQLNPRREKQFGSDPWRGLHTVHRDWRDVNWRADQGTPPPPPHTAEFAPMDWSHVNWNPWHESPPPPPPPPEEEQTAEPAPPPEPEWCRVFDVRPEADLQTIKAAYHRLVKKYHPDAGGNHGSDVIMAKINSAFEEAKRAAGERRA